MRSHHVWVSLFLCEQWGFRVDPEEKFPSRRAYNDQTSRQDVSLAVLARAAVTAIERPPLETKKPAGSGLMNGPEVSGRPEH
jgi:hypothetical protein